MKRHLENAKECLLNQRCIVEGLVRKETVALRRCASPGGGALLGILGGGVQSGSPNPDPISDQ